MGFFKKLFGSSDQTVVKPIKTLDDLLATDLKNFNPEGYEKGKREEHSPGHAFNNYYKEFDSEEAGVFRYLNARVFESGGRNYLFNNKRPNKYHRDHLRKLVTNLYNIYGKDDQGRGPYTSNDDEEIEQEYWSGRMWTKSESQPSLMIGSTEEGGFDMSVFKKPGE